MTLAEYLNLTLLLSISISYCDWNRHNSNSSTATDANDNASLVHQLVSTIHSTAQTTSDIENDQKARASLLQLSRELTRSLEAPDEICSNVAFSGGLFMCVRLADELRIFDLLCESSPRTIPELAKTTGAEEGLIRRILRTLAGMGFATQLGIDEYAATAVSRQMTIRNVRAGVKFFHEESLPSVRHAPEYFKQNGWHLPKSMTDGPYQFAERTSEDPFTHMSTKPGVMENFNVFMQGLFGTPNRLGWTDGWFPIQERILDGFDSAKGEYCFVDVGGGKGHECELLLKRFPEMTGKLVTQDLPFVINDIQQLDERVERMEYDFTKPQPVKGARAYFLQNILHNWATDVCREILLNLKSAMVPGYSKIIVGNIILPDQNVPLRNSGLDIAMLVLHSGQQRSEGEFRGLFESVGLRVIKMWHPPGDGDGIIEAELAA